MRVVLFYSGVESFNYFTDEIAKELAKREYTTYILDLRDMQGAKGHTMAGLTSFIESGGVDLVISYDGFGIKEPMFIELWDAFHVRCANILMDHPLRFHETMETHPRRYVQFCCDENHVAYVKRFFPEHVPKVYFLPHAGTMPPHKLSLDADSYVSREYDILFSGTYYPPETKLAELLQWFDAGSVMERFYRTLFDVMCGNPAMPTEEAVLWLMEQSGLEMSIEKTKTVLRCSEPVDWAVRQFFRGEAVRRIAEAGLRVWLIGRGWENHPSCVLPNVHRISDRVPFAETLQVMERAKVSLNVMPHFKAGSHDRIFNSFLRGALPLTDPSSFLEEAYGDELEYFHLTNLDELPRIAENLLQNPGESADKIKIGYEVSATRYTWRDLVDKLMEVCAHAEI